MKYTATITPAGKALIDFIEKTPKVVRMSAGFFDGPKYEDGRSVASVAYDNEYGVAQKQQPPRPFIRPTLAINGKKWIEIVRQSAGGAAKGGLNVIEIFDVLGEIVEEDIKKSINRVKSPVLSPRTIAERRERGNNSTKPLEDTMLMFNSVDHRVGNK